MRILLTGAGSGIGQTLAQRLAKRGDELWVVVRSPDRAAELPDAHVLVADLADPDAVAALDLPVELDGVVHAAGVVELGAVADLSAEAWQSQMLVNVVAPALLTKAALPALRAAHGTVVFVNSGAGLQASPQWSAYGASKFGLRALADALRAEEPEIRVCTVFPGRTATPMQEKVHAQEGKEYDAGRWIRPETVADGVLHVLDLPRDATVTDLMIKPNG